MSRNRLSEATSPYLLQHADNPVHWQPWDDKALAEATETGKPILLSVGYAACHWCHVMAHESFESPEIAEIMNQRFVNIKVDREERPDLDSIYQAALALLGQQGGWPLTMFLTPERQPFWGGTYFPPTSRYGRPGFADVLTSVADVYAKEPDKVETNVTALQNALAEMASATEPQPIDDTVRTRIANHLAEQFDAINGGLQGAPKFPHFQAAELLWRAYLRTGTQAYAEHVLLMAERMSNGGIYDHLGGGYARYSVDERWLAPHFEKMLYDNAQMIDLLCQVWQGTRHPLFRQRAVETVDWLTREMLAPAEQGVAGQAFAATLDADSEGEEGKFYVWSEAEIDEVLGDDSALFKEFYDVTSGGNWEGKTILNRLERPEDADEATGERLAGMRAKLLERRAGRVRPARDDKVLADWNGLMIAALANASAVFDRADWADLATGAYAYVKATMSADGRLGHVRRLGQTQAHATIDDYANMILAALALYQLDGAQHYLDDAVAWLETADGHYWDAESGGYFATADDVGDVIVRTRSSHDSAQPAGNALMAEALARLWLITGRADYRDRAEAVVHAFSGGLSRSYFPLCGLINAAEVLEAAQQVVIVGTAGDAATNTLAHAVHSVPAPNKTVIPVADGGTLPADHPAHGKQMVDGQPTAYVCAGMVCSAPVTDPAAVRAALGAGDAA